MHAKIERAWIEVIPDDDPDPSYLEQDEFADRLDEYRRGEFAFVGVRACAEIRFDTDQGGWTHGPVVQSPGLWGIEDDSGEDYFRSVGKDEAIVLGDMLRAIGFDGILGFDMGAFSNCTELRYR